jgi:hypothetical protein
MVVSDPSKDGARLAATLNLRRAVLNAADKPPGRATYAPRIVSLYVHVTFGRQRMACKDAEEARLTRANRPADTEDFALSYGQAEWLDNGATLRGRRLERPRPRPGLYRDAVGLNRCAQATRPPCALHILAGATWMLLLSDSPASIVVEKGRGYRSFPRFRAPKRPNLNGDIVQSAYIKMAIYL